MKHEELIDFTPEGSMLSAMLLYNLFSVIY